MVSKKELKIIIIIIVRKLGKIMPGICEEFLNIIRYVPNGSSKLIIFNEIKI